MREMCDDDSGSRRRGSWAGAVVQDPTRPCPVSWREVVDEVRTYRVEIERDSAGIWVASVPSVPGAHTQGRTIDQARRRIREGISLWVGDADGARLEIQRYCS